MGPHLADRPLLTVAILAAGQSRRFGSADKLHAMFRGKALGQHVCETLARARFALRPQNRLVIAAEQDHPCAKNWRDAGFSVVHNPNASEGMGTSVAAAARIARRSGSDALLIALADMPLVPVAHFAALAEAGRNVGSSATVSSSDGTVRMPPALFGSDHFDALADLEGDSGARSLLLKGEVINCSPDWLVDIDTPEALAALS